MDESAPFVSLKSQDDMWDDENSEEFNDGLQPAAVHYKSLTFCNRTKIAVSVVAALLIIIIIALAVLVAQKKGEKNRKETLCLKPGCITASYGKWNC